MKICIAQTEPKNGNVSANIEAHKRFIDLALTFNAEAIFFPELSLTGYEPELAKKLATNQNDNRLDIFQQISDNNNIIIGLGLPTATESQIRISMIIFEPNKPRQTYSKQQLHSDELPYFEYGVGQVIIKTDNTHIAPAICYESLQPTHSEKAFKLGADIYLASVAKSAVGMTKAFKHYHKIAKQYSMIVLMSNCIGYCDNFESAGKSSIWNKNGLLLGQLNGTDEGILIIDTNTEQIIERTE
jgi:predicted amidohydrolase